MIGQNTTGQESQIVWEEDQECDLHRFLEDHDFMVVEPFLVPLVMGMQLGRLADPTEIYYLVRHGKPAALLFAVNWNHPHVATSALEKIDACKASRVPSLHHGYSFLLLEF